MTDSTKTKTGGRQAGTPNKLTSQTRQLLQAAIESELEALPRTLNRLEPAQRIDALTKLIKYVLPALETISARNADKLGLRDDADIVDELVKENKQERRLDFLDL